MKKYSEYFERRTRTDNGKFTCLNNETPDELREFVQAVHHGHDFDCLPNDWIYEIMSEAFEELERDKLEDINIEADVYTRDLLNWLDNPYAISYCNDAMEDMQHEAFLDIIREAQWRAKDRIYSLVNDFMEEHENDEEESEVEE